MGKKGVKMVVVQKSPSEAAIEFSKDAELVVVVPTKQRRNFTGLATLADQIGNLQFGCGQVVEMKGKPSSE